MAEKSIIEKLNLMKYSLKLIINKPEDITDFEGLGYDDSYSNKKYDLIFIFAFTIEEIMSHLEKIKNEDLVNNKGYIYIAYPKKGNSKYKAYIGRDDLYNGNYYDEEGYLHDSHLKFARMASFNEDFTVVGIKHEPKSDKKSTKASQCVDDYINRVDDIKTYLKKDEKVLKIYEDLTPGYQKDWARYIFSAKREETQEKRKSEMEKVLSEGYKTMDLYRMNKK